MKKYLASTVALLLLLTAFPVLAAADGLKVRINAKPVAFSDAQPYVNGSTVMLPIRATSEALGMKVTFDKTSKEVRLTAEGVNIAFKPGSAKASKNGAEVQFGTASVTRRGWAYVPLSFFKEILRYETAYNAAKNEASITSFSDPEQTANEVIRLLTAGSHQQLSDDFFDDSLKKAVSVSQLGQTWKEVVQTAGKYVGVKSVDSAPGKADTTIVTAVLQLDKLDAKLTLVVNGSQKLNGLLLQYVPIDVPPPSGVVEEKVTVGQGTAYPLGGTLTMPKNAAGPLPAVVLVQGSGPSDRDESAGAYKPFRDIAWGLAQQGIAVIRYDKRTFAYPAAFAPENAAKMTVKEETVDDAILAAKLLKSDSRIDPTRVYLLGHSQGGMLAPRIDAEGGDFAGIVVLAGTPRTLWELIYDQTANFIQAMKDDDPAKKTNEMWLKTEFEKANKIAAMSDEEAMASAVFGLPAYYFKEMDSHSAADYAAKLVKPVLILQGEDDFQVFADKDYLLWQKLLDGKTNVSYKLYPGLNHFFVDYRGEGEGTLDEYRQPGTVSETVIRDVADWILKR